MKVGMLLGLVIGLLTLFGPSLLWPREIPKLTSQVFRKLYPDKKWVYYIHIGLPIIWILLYLFIIAPVLWENGDKYLYLISFFLGGGLAFGHGTIEIISRVSMRNFSRGGQAIYVVDESIRRLGSLRIGFVIFSGLIPLIFVILLST